MKKFTLLAAVAGVALAASAVESTIVGYTTATIESGHYKAFAVHFSPVENPTAGIPVNQFVTVTPLATVPAFGGAMDQIWRWDTTVNKWAKYGYQKPARNGTAAWRKYDANSNTFSELTNDDAIADNEGFLYYRGNDATLTLTFKALQPTE